MCNSKILSGSFGFLASLLVACSMVSEKTIGGNVKNFRSALQQSFRIEVKIVNVVPPPAAVQEPAEERKGGGGESKERGLERVTLQQEAKEEQEEEGAAEPAEPAAPATVAQNVSQQPKRGRGRGGRGRGRKQKQQQEQEQEEHTYNIKCKLREPESGANETLQLMGKKLHCVDVNDPTHAGVYGEWRKLTSERNRTYPANICCPMKERKLKGRNANKPWNPFCSEKIMGGLGNARNYTGDPEFYQQMPGNGCYCAGEDPWVWYPSSRSRHQQKQKPTSPLRFDKHKACQLLGDRTVLMVGDSTMQQTATSLMNAFYKTSCAAQFRFIQGDNLLQKGIEFTTVEGLGKVYNRGKHWKKALLEMSSFQKTPSIVLVAVGPHVHLDERYTEIVQNVTRDMEQLQKTTHPNMQFIFKTQHPGGCTNFVDPDVDPNNLNVSPGLPFLPNHPTLAARSLNKQTPYEHQLYHNSYYDRDLWLINHVQDMVQANPNFHMHVMDVRPMYSRTDKKLGSNKIPPGDCLHLCSPGPLDIVGPLFYQLLQKMEQ